jgi:hypothetical protein
MILSGSALLVLFAFVTICGACRFKKVRVGLFKIQIDEGRNVGDERMPGNRGAIPMPPNHYPSKSIFGAAGTPNSFKLFERNAGGG